MNKCEMIKNIDKALLRKIWKLTLIAVVLIRGAHYRPLDDEPSGRLLQGSLGDLDSHPIQIVFDYANVSSADANLKELLQFVVVPHIHKRLQPLIQVPRQSVIQTRSSVECLQAYKVSSYSNNRLYADYLVLVLINDEPAKSYLAFSKVCDFDAATKRPNFGLISINKSYFQFTVAGINSFISTLLHEIFHLLIFSNSIYFVLNSVNNSFSNVVTDAGNHTKTYIVAEEFIKYANEYFDCPKISGLPMENEGGSTSENVHFEKLIFNSEIMTSSITAVAFISPFTLTLLNSSRWYRVNFDYGETMTWGYKKGCKFLSDPGSAEFDEFCNSEGQVDCSPDYMTKSVCIKSNYSDENFIKEYYKYMNCRNTYEFRTKFEYEVPGKNSRCFKVESNGLFSSFVSAGCFKVDCNQAKNKIFIYIENNTFVCTSKGQYILYKTENIMCPDPVLFCEKSKLEKCKDDCNGRGACLDNGTCFCDFLFSGDSCENIKSCNELGNLCEQSGLSLDTQFNSQAWTLLPSVFWIALICLIIR